MTVTEGDSGTTEALFTITYRRLGGNSYVNRQSLYYWAWTGLDEQCWLIRQLRVDILGEVSPSSRQNRWRVLSRFSG